MTGRVRRVNEIGAGFKGIDNERMKDLRIYEESGSVQIWVEVADFQSRGGNTIEVMQYLTPSEAMAFARAFERCEIEALKKGAE